MLFLADVADQRTYGAAFYNETHAVYVGVSRPVGASAERLVNREDVTMFSGLRPFSVHGMYSSITAVAPPGCVIASAPDGRVRADGTLALTWSDLGDLVTQPRAGLGPWWRVTCGGVVRELDYHAMDQPPLFIKSPTVTERGQADPEMIANAMLDCRRVPGMAVDTPRAVWGGTLPGNTESIVVVTSTASDGSVHVCAFSGTGASMTLLVTGVAGGPLDLSRSVVPPWRDPNASKITTAAAPSGDILAVRLPASDGSALSDRLLVIAPVNATELRISGSSTIPLTGGVGVVTMPVPAQLNLTAVDATDQTIATLRVAEPTADGLLAGQGQMQRW
ncbi:hypothetical protein GCM10010399_48320 [Dactylosporangium fulvum]|uniref:Uncharacterized protein n=1 Tax=Dactylosporangium fulvum TaxID=53359 RepID=A0ABY5VUP4_9ACTN|nr:hypothetical protein [Dactylosporangium fulvum]UWP80566.1 hypothetical protein Dfulv_36170 [Dactylosporangium fulvum]